MHLATFAPALFALLSLVSPSSAVKGKPSNAILLSNVKSLTLRAGKQTSHRRVGAVPQLTCEGPGCKHYTIDTMRCVNAGSDYSAEDIQWTCTASVPEEFKLGSTDVVCEGYDSSEDDYVLKGSCGVTYRLMLTEKGKERYGGDGWFSSKPAGKHSNNEVGSSGILFGVIFVAVAAWILYSMWTAYNGAPGARRAPRTRGGGGWGGFGGGGGGGGDEPLDPPPPYPGKPGSSRTSRAGAPAQQGWRPGFWTGAASGAAAAYLAGNRGQRQAPPPRNSGWFGGGNSDTGSGWGAGPSRSTRSSAGSSDSPRYESTGFGSTSRR